MRLGGYPKICLYFIEKLIVILDLKSWIENVYMYVGMYVCIYIKNQTIFYFEVPLLLGVIFFKAIIQLDPFIVRS